MEEIIEEKNREEKEMFGVPQMLMLLFMGGVSRSDPAPKDLSVSGEEAERLAERLLKNYGDSILRLAYIYLHNRSDAEDVLQETLLSKSAGRAEI